ncbi:MAG: hypothetical protein L0Y58_07145 [Verrucomicrobia subdivision 3 bacterium]|nr:hypothetical protein [Limisphaerales bacterium]
MPTTPGDASRTGCGIYLLLTAGFFLQRQFFLYRCASNKFPAEATTVMSKGARENIA